MWRTWLDSRIALHMMIITFFVQIRRGTPRRWAVMRWLSDVYVDIYAKRTGMSAADVGDVSKKPRWYKKSARARGLSGADEPPPPSETKKFFGGNCREVSEFVE